MLDSCAPAACEWDVAECALADRGEAGESAATLVSSGSRPASCRGPGDTLRRNDAGVAMTDSGPVSGAVAGPARGTACEDETTAASAAARGGPWPFWLPVGMLFVGLILTGVFVAISASAHSSTEKRLSDLMGLRFADSSAIALWVRWSTAVHEIELRDVSPFLRRVMDSVRLADTLNVKP